MGLESAISVKLRRQRRATMTLLCDQVEFREDLKALFEKAAVGGKPVTFLFNDNQVKMSAGLPPSYGFDVAGDAS